MVFQLETTSSHVVTNKMTMIQAINHALKTMLEADERTLILGEDVGKNGGVFRATEGLYEVFGDERVIDTPLSESGIVGTSVGLAVNGFKPIAEMQFMGFIYPAYDQIMTHVARIRMKTMGHFTVPLVIRAPYGAGIRAPEIHSDSAESLFTHMPGIKVVCPSDPYAAKGLLIAAVEDPDPVLFMEPMRSYRANRVEVPTEKYTLEIGKGRLLREGEDITIIAWGAMVPIAEQAATYAEQKGITADVIDLQTLYPFDRDIITQSVQKTGRAVIVHEAHATGGFGNDLVSHVNDTAFLYLRAPIQRVTGFDVPVPYFALEEHYLPTAKRLLTHIEKAVHF
ncbi:alpha-ketoacid dehydrogenase subunit beta [Virgibacillus soli]|uniref:Alpha-ketoacid dehydrogenase subunit beta n=1 Tax=Paracerasibacillus soli TaxID=480284 RepID=A0ABU5CTB2_9BACI|nr:alpha-ketoacid dehydrogenase subunit beta [Virgibacillus soli]MDY0409605.1 alpha-ketoacid dehydrogenase subunit beta [Virgibacillus soli]